MKQNVILLSAALVLSTMIIPSRGEAQTRARRERAKLEREINSSAVKLSSYDRFRKVNGEFCDLMPLFLQLQNTYSTNAPILVNTESVDKWHWLCGKVFQISDDGLLVQTYSDGTFDEDTKGDLIFLKHFPKEKDLIDGDKIITFACELGPHSYVNTSGARKTILGYDRGEKATEAEVAKYEKEQEPQRQALKAMQAATIAKQKAAAEKRKAEAAAAALKFHQGLADKGDAYGQLRMGERYLAGDGVEKDVAKAKEYFTKAAAQGNKDAEIALEKLKAKP